MAIRKSHAEIVEALLGKNANINAQDWRNYTPLHMAAEIGHVEIVEALLNVGAYCECKKCTELGFYYGNTKKVIQK
ncbi:ankyrin repeat domain-containing protein [Cardinium endosymbiont of Culicoides punctatus]|uniref:ankyrin repeat domain-containing protein n=1 Tax=Cardinium endosymbiont of Culicoides punctatus TaxID=2304601 RepID=UPI00105863A8|nr:ankyrin repeat domain-containing protein [Cardinium endosymbiont of Culicoides punctatus]